MLLLKQNNKQLNFDEESIKLTSLFLGLPSKEIISLARGVSIIDKDTLSRFTSKHILDTVYKKNVFYFEDGSIVLNIENLVPIYNHELLIMIWAWLNKQEEDVVNKLDSFNTSIMLLQSEVVEHQLKMEKLVKEFYNSYVTNTFQPKRLEKELKRLKLNTEILSGRKIRVYKSNLRYNNIIYNNIIIYIEDWRIVDFEIKVKGGVSLKPKDDFQIRIHPKLSVMDMPYGFNGVLSWCIGDYPEYADSIYNIFYPSESEIINVEDVKLNILRLKKISD